MKKTIFLIIAILLFSITIAVFFNNSINVKAKTINVNYDGSAEYTSIQEAINASSDGDTVYVHSGTYYENIIIPRSKSITLQGENKYTTIVDGEKEGSIFFVNADYVKITGFTIRHSGVGGSYPDYFAGINLRTHDITITDNIIENNVYGITSSYYDTQTYGYPGQRCDNLSIYDNILENNSYGIDLNGVYYADVYNNIFLNQIDTAESKTGGDAINIGGCEYCMIYNNKITNCVEAFNIYNSGNNSIYLNEITNISKNGFYLWPGHYNKIVGNTIKDSHLGIHLDYNSKHNTIFLNNFINNTEDLIQDYNSRDNKIDNGQYGNYWSNYDGVDNNNNGIGDSPNIKIPDGFNQDHEATLTDHYPLMSQWQSKFDENQLKQFIEDSSEDTKSKKEKDNGGSIPGFETIILTLAITLIVLYNKKKY